MKRFLYISSLLVFVIGLTSCTKEEVESPTETHDAKALPIEGVQSSDHLQDDQNAVYIDPTPMQINDDGDDEDEGINTNKIKK